ncbi:MAG: 50S ribosomal protein L30 [Bacteroidota bacterium]
MATLKITQTRSTIRRSQVQKRTIEALGLGRIGKSVEQNDTPQIQGMIAKVRHLVAVEPVDAA